MPVTSAPSQSDLLSDPKYLLFDLRAGPDLLFAGVTMETYLQSAFLDHRISPKPEQFYRLPLAALGNDLSALPPPPALIIAHTSFCCSTLLARCLQAPDLLSLREPRVLGGLANEYRRSLAHAQLDPLTAIVFRLLAKIERTSQQVLIKGTNYTNNLLMPLLRLWPHCKILLMWGTLEDFLLSMCKHRDEAERNLWPFLRGFLIDAGYPAAEHAAWAQLDVLQKAVWVWALQIRQFRALLGEYSHIRTLAAKDFLAQAVPVCEVIHRDLGIVMSATQRTRQVANYLDRDAKKNNVQVTHHTAARADLREHYRHDIELVIDWARAANLLPDSSVLQQRALVLS